MGKAKFLVTVDFNADDYPEIMEAQDYDQLKEDICVGILDFAPDDVELVSIQGDSLEKLTENLLEEEKEEG